nr:MAG: nucleocapsid protein [Xinjiang sediment orthomyxo-like virus 4]
MGMIKNYYDLSGEKVSGKSKTGAPQDPEGKKKALHAIILAHGAMAKEMMFPPTSNDINQWEDATSGLFTGWVMYRQGLNSITAFAQRIKGKRNETKGRYIEKCKSKFIYSDNNKYFSLEAIPDTAQPAPKKQKVAKAADKGESSTITDVPMEKDEESVSMDQSESSKVVKVDRLIEIWKECIKRVYGEINKDHDCVGTINTYMGLFNAFKRRVNEIAYPTGSFITGKTADVVNVIKPQLFGLDETHFHLLCGLNYAPQLAASITQTLGPLTIALKWCMANPTQNYSKKWKNAFLAVFGLLDDAEQLCEYVNKNGKENPHVFRLLAVAAEYGLARNNNKMYLPFAAIAVAYPLENFTDPTSYVYGSLDKLAQIDFSGKGMWRIINLMKGKILKWKIASEASVCKQMFIHGMLGTHVEDLTLLEAISDTTFQRRNEMGNTFKKDQKKTIEFTCPEFKYISKLASSATSKMTGGGIGQQSRNPIFAGNCYQELGAQAFLIRRMENAGPNPININMNPVDKLEARLRNIASALRAAGRVDFGNTRFFINRKDSENPYGTDEEQKELVPPLRLGGKYYLSRN